MKFTLGWLKDHLDTQTPLEKISEALTALGLEVESVTDFGKQLAPFKVAKILAAEPHPQADRLRVCQVATGMETLQIVCGAPNARAGIHVVLAPIGAVIPTNGMVIKKSAIRGVESNGMLCSAEELGISGDSEGILELPEAALGSAAAAALGLDDALIDIAITPNRADCLGVRGLARDLAAKGLGVLKPEKAEKNTGAGISAITVALEAGDNAPYYIGRYFSGVKNGESPIWLQNRLRAIGQKPISALVDITNYLTFDQARPLHVYDAAKLSGGLSVRAAKPGEKMTALNDKEYTLDTDILVIADQKAPVAIAGIIGGKDSGVNTETTDIFLEVAYFNPSSIRKAGQKLQIDSDAKYRFERGVDPAFLETGAEMATRMILELCGGKASELVVAGKSPWQPREIKFDAMRCETLGGVKVAKDEAEKILKSLGLPMKSDGKFQIPSSRADIEGEADLVEEILRVKGYENIPATPLPQDENWTRPSVKPHQRVMADMRRTLAARGMTESVTFSFMHSEKAKWFGGIAPELMLLNPISAELDGMRPSILPNLMDAVHKNTARGIRNLGLFEIGPVYEGVKPEQNRLMAAGLRSGATAAKNLYKETRGIDAFDAKADLFALLSLAINPEKATLEAIAPSHFHPGRSGSLKLGNKVLGSFGELHPALLQAWDMEETTIAFELYLDAVPAPAKALYTKIPLSDYQAVTRDFAFVVDHAVAAETLTRAVKNAEKNLIREVTIFDIYAGKGLSEGKKSVAISVVLQAADRTLGEKEIEAAAEAIIAKAAKDAGATLRS